MKRENSKDFLGLVASHTREIKPGNEFNKYFPAADVKNHTVNPDGNVRDTVGIMLDMVITYKNDTKSIAPLFKGKTLEETCRNIWHFAYNHIQYKLDKDGVEQLRRPARTWHDRVTGVDCDCFSIFVGSILYNLGINFRFRITKYGAGWQHVYVVVPEGKRNIVIDCVLDKFNEEKPYFDKNGQSEKAKEDYDMNKHTLSGIPIEVLSGLSDIGTIDAELDGIISVHNGFMGLGESPATKEQQYKAIHDHILATRNYIAKNPLSVLTVGGAKNNLQLLDYALKYWNTPLRDKAIDELERAEEKLYSESGVSGFGEDEEEDGLGRKKKKIAPKLFANIKKAVTEIKKDIKHVGEEAKDLAGKALKAIVKVNPLSIAARAGFLLALKINLFGMGAKLYPGTNDTYQSGRGWTPEEWQASRNAYLKIENNFVNKMQGESKNLKSAITSGRASKEFTGVSGLGSLGDPATLTVITASAAPLIQASKDLDEAGVTSSDKKKFFAKLVEFFKKTGVKIAGLFKKKKANGEEDDGSNTTTEETIGPEDESTDPSADTTTTEDGGSSVSTKDKDGKDKGGNGGGSTDKGFFDKAGKWIAANPVKATGAGLLLAAAVTLAVSPKARAWVSGGKKKSASLGAVIYKGGKRRLKKSHLLPKNSKVKSITLK
jgi:hypothetical protein